MPRKIPHLTDTEAIRAEAAREHGQLDDAATMIQTWHANLDPNLEATALKKVNIAATEEVLQSLEDDGDDSVVHQKLAAYEKETGTDYGLTYIASAAVRGHALVIVGADGRGNPKKVVVPWDDKFQSVGLSEAEKARRAVATYEGKTRDLGKEARAEIERRVAEARAEIGEDTRKEIEKLRAEFAAAKEDVSASSGGEGESGSGSGSGSGGASGSGADGDVKYPSTHNALNKLAKANGVEFAPKANVPAKQEALRKAGVKPA